MVSKCMLACDPGPWGIDQGLKITDLHRNHFHLGICFHSSQLDSHIFKNANLQLAFND